MQFPGHLALALATHSLPFFWSNSRQKLVSLLIASLWPDLVDKTIGYGCHLMPNGRHYAHNVFSLGGSSLLVGLIWGRPTGLAWFAGYLGHLLADSDGLMPWFFPLRQYPFKKGRLRFKPDQLLSETLICLLVITLRHITKR